MNINSIQIPENRQRRSNREIDAGFVSSVGRRLINPITLRRGENGQEQPILVAGERRLLGLRAFGLLELEHNIHFRFLEDLTAEEAEIIELEENVKREDLDWRDQAQAIGRIHKILKDKQGASDEKIAEELNMSSGKLSMSIFVFRNLESPNLRDATGIRQAYSILQGIAERRAVSIVQDIGKAGSRLFRQETTDEPNREIGNGSGIQSPLDSPTDSSNSSSTNLVQPLLLVNDRPSGNSPSDILPILNQDFIQWANTYSGDKFTLIHCDFPYDVKYDSYARSVSSVTEDYDFSGFWPLMDALCENLDRLMSYSAHLMFWFSMKFYSETKLRLEKAGLYVHDHPLIWHKTDNSGIIPGRDAIFPRRTYETALLATRGRRPLVRSLSNIHGAPMASQGIHPSQKPIPVLRHFFGMLVDETTDVLDPTAGSGTSLLAAELEGARRVVGLELNPTYATAANAMIATERRMRKISG